MSDPAALPKRDCQEIRFATPTPSAKARTWLGPVEGLRRKIIVLRRAGKLHGWLDACPHYPGGTPMAWKSDVYLNGEGTHLACHSHGALFDIETGECVLGPCRDKLTRVELTLTELGTYWSSTRWVADKRRCRAIAHGAFIPSVASSTSAG